MITRRRRRRWPKRRVVSDATTGSGGCIIGRHHPALPDRHSYTPIEPAGRRCCGPVHNWTTPGPQAQGPGRAALRAKPQGGGGTKRCPPPDPGERDPHPIGVTSCGPRWPQLLIIPARSDVAVSAALRTTAATGDPSPIPAAWHCGVVWKCSTDQDPADRGRRRPIMQSGLAAGLTEQVRATGASGDRVERACAGRRIRRRGTWRSREPKSRLSVQGHNPSPSARVRGPTEAQVEVSSSDAAGRRPGVV